MVRATGPSDRLDFRGHYRGLRGGVLSFSVRRRPQNRHPFRAFRQRHAIQALHRQTA